MKRRDILKTALLGTGAALGGQDHPHSNRLAANAAAAAAAAEAETWKPLLFDSHQNKTVVALTDLIIPVYSTLSTASKHNEVVAGLSRASAVRWRKKRASLNAGDEAIQRRAVINLGVWARSDRIFMAGITRDDQVLVLTLPGGSARIML